MRYTWDEKYLSAVMEITGFPKEFFMSFTDADYEQLITMSADDMRKWSANLKTWFPGYIESFGKNNERSKYRTEMGSFTYPTGVEPSLFNQEELNRCNEEPTLVFEINKEDIKQLKAWRICV